MEAKLTLDAHPDADTLEEYVFGRLHETLSEDLEEHLLICYRCQSALVEVDEYILLMKHATALLATDRRGWQPESTRASSNGTGSRGTGSRWIKVGMGATVAAAVIGSLVFWLPRRTPIQNSVQLMALRDDDIASLAHAPGGPLDLVIDVSDLPGIGRFHLEVVNAAGRRHWEGSATPSNGKLTARVRKALDRGTYWVRLSAGAGELLREFGLRAD